MIADADQIRQVVVGAAIVRDGRLLAARRRVPAALAGGWELPGGKVEPGESEPAALVRECREELGVIVRPVAPVPGEWPLRPGMAGDEARPRNFPGDEVRPRNEADPESPNREADPESPSSMVLRIYLAELVVGEPVPLEDHDELRWLAADELFDVAWLPADRPAVAAVRAQSPGLRAAA